MRRQVGKGRVSRFTMGTGLRADRAFLRERAARGRPAIDRQATRENEQRGEEEAAPAGGLPLAGKTVVVTGTLANYDRVGIENAIKDAGGKTTGSVSKKTDFVLVGDKPGSKYDKAKELGVKIITEEEFRKLIGK